MRKGGAAQYPRSASAVRSISPHDHTFPALDGLRGLAVSLVLLVHLSAAMRAQIADGPVASFWSAVSPLSGMGGTGVHLFFVLSGFLLFLPYARTLLIGTRRPSSRRFYKRRLLRILPAYYVALGVVALALEPDVLRANAVEQISSHALLLHNYSVGTWET